LPIFKFLQKNQGPISKELGEEMPLPAGIKEIPVESGIKTNMLWETYRE
jgi:hypothetical protein